MKARASRFVFPTAITLRFAGLSFAQVPDISLSGAVAGPGGTVVPSVNISVRNLNTGSVTETVTDAAGHYFVRMLPPGDYEVSASAQGFNSSVATVTLAAGTPQTLNLTLAAPAPTSTLANAPSSSKTEPSLSDLGFSPEQTQSNAREQALLDKRTHNAQSPSDSGLDHCCSPDRDHRHLHQRRR